MTVSKRLRYEVLRRDNHQCRYCGAVAPDATLTVDHVVPTALGGGDDPSNLVTACRDCNAGKSASTADAALVADVDARAMRWAQAMKVANDRRSAELADDRECAEVFARTWNQWTVGDGNELVPLPGHWRSSVIQFLGAGLDDQFLTDAVATAMGNTNVHVSGIWRYFCGICWRELDKRRDLTTVIAEDEQPGPVDEFPLVYLAACYVMTALSMAEVPHEAVMIAARNLQPALESAHVAFLSGPGQEGESAAERCCDVFDSITAQDMQEIRRICSAGERVPSGS